MSYSVGHSDHTLLALQTRQAQHCAGFMLPSLKDGSRLLDCGCGPGSITADFGEMLPNGSVVGIDIEPKAIDAAKRLGQTRRVENMTLTLADVCALPFPDQTFDVVFAHSLLMHLPQPLDAVKEIRRVVKQTGMAAIADPDMGARVWHPTSELMDTFQQLYLRVLESNGAHLYYARGQRSLFKQAGFSNSEGHSFSVTFGSARSTALIGRAWEEYARSEVFRNTVTAHGWASDSLVEEMCLEIRYWSSRSDAYLGLLCCGTVAWP